MAKTGASQPPVTMAAGETAFHDVATQCLKVAVLRQKYGPGMTLEAWMKNPAHLYIGRQGRVWITHPVTRARHIFHYRASKWANPFKVGKKAGEYSLPVSLKRYREYVLQGSLVKDLPELQGRVLGCFCDQTVGCHAVVLAQLYRERVFDCASCPGEGSQQPSDN
eukprot:GGOE01019972.1.p1 GENE.GGOE01019972.1~~GGOE01019972.1.p1  ORF type:complete len:192 (-),score=35.34 GGOE01019972.1:271-765(-)